MLETVPDIDAPCPRSQKVSQFIHQLKVTKQPIVLTVNGKMNLVVQDAESCQKLLELAEGLEAIEAIREGLQDEAEGRLVSLEEAMEIVREKHGLSL